MERRHLPGELGQRPGRLLQPWPGRQHLLQHQRPEFPHQGYRDFARCPRRARADPAGRGFLEPEPADQFAGTDQQQSGQRGFRQADHSGLPTPRHNCAPVTNPFGPVGSPSANAPPLQFSLRARYEWAWRDTCPSYRSAPLTTAIRSRRRARIPTIADNSGAVTTGRLRFENPAYTTYDASPVWPRMLGRSTCTARTSRTRTRACLSAPISSSWPRPLCGRGCSGVQSATSSEDAAAGSCAGERAS